MEETFLTCPFCNKKLFTVISSEKYMWTKCEHLLYLSLGNEDTLFVEDNIKKFLQERALPLKFLRDYLDFLIASKEEVSREEGIPLGLTKAFLNFPVTYCARDKEIVFLKLKDFAMNILPVKKVEISLRTFYTLHFCKENLIENVKNKQFKFESCGNYANLSIPHVFLKKVEAEKEEEIAEWCGLTLKEFKDLAPDEKEDVVSEYIIGELFSDPIESFNLMKELGLNPEEYIESLSLDDFFEQEGFGNPLLLEHQNIAVDKLKSMGFNKREIKKIIKLLFYTNLKEVVYDPTSSFALIRKVLESFIHSQLKNAGIHYLPYRAKFRDKLDLLNNISQKKKRDLIEVWIICSKKYIHAGDFTRSYERVKYDFLFCRNVIRNILINQD